MKTLLEKTQMLLNQEITINQYRLSVKRQDGIDEIWEIMENEELVELFKEEFHAIIEKNDEWKIVYVDDFNAEAIRIKKEAIAEAIDLASEGYSIYCETYWPSGGNGTITYNYVNDYLDGSDIPEVFHDCFYEKFGHISLDEIMKDRDYYIDIQSGKVVIEK